MITRSTSQLRRTAVERLTESRCRQPARAGSAGTSSRTARATVAATTAIATDACSPAERAAQLRGCRYADDGGRRDTPEDDGRRQRHPGLGHQPRSDSGGQGPETSHPDPDQHASSEHGLDVRSEGRCEVAQRDECDQDGQHYSAVEATGVHRDQRSADGRNQTRDRHHQPGDAGGDAEVSTDRGQDADREELGRHQREDGDADGPDAEPGARRRAREGSSAEVLDGHPLRAGQVALRTCD